MPPGPMKGRHYDKDIDGTWEQFKNDRQSWRSRFQPGGDIYERNQKEDFEIAAALLDNPNMSDAQFAALLNSLGIYNQKEQRQSRFRSLEGARKGTVLYNTNAHLDDGGWRDVATSDESVRGVWQPFDKNLGRQASKLQNGGFANYLLDELGVGSFRGWLDRGETGMEYDDESGLYYNTDANGVTWWDKDGFQRDPQSGARIGHYMGGRSGGSFSQPRGGSANFTRPTIQPSNQPIRHPPVTPGTGGTVRGIGPREPRPYLNVGTPMMGGWGSPTPMMDPSQATMANGQPMYPTQAPQSPAPANAYGTGGGVPVAKPISGQGPGMTEAIVGAGDTSAQTPPTRERKVRIPGRDPGRMSMF